MQSAFGVYGIEDIVDGTRAIPADMTAAAGIKYKKDEARAKLLISSAIDYSQLEYLVTCATAKDMWQKLSAIHERKSTSNKLVLMQHFHEYKMAQNDSVAQHFSKVENMARQLKDVGELVSDTSIMAKILGSLPSKFGALITAWDSVPADSQTLANLQERLLKEESRLTAHDQEAGAFAATSKKGDTSQTRNSSRGRGKQKAQHNSKTKDVTCYYCQSKGHFAYQCRKKQRDQGDTSETRAQSGSLRLWHECLGHVNNQTIKDLIRRGMITGAKLTDIDNFFCEACQYGKIHRLPFKKKEVNRVTDVGEMFHADVCGPMSTESLSGARFYFLLKDDRSACRHVFFIRHKSDVFEKFKEFEKMVSNKFNRRMRTLRVDNGTEFINKPMKDYLSNCGIKLETTAPSTPEQNGKSERENRSIVESGRTMLHAQNLPLCLWEEAMRTAVYTLNRTLYLKEFNATPYELWTGKKPDLGHLRVFGSTAYLHVPKIFRKKLDRKAKKYILVGYQNDSANYRLFDSKTKEIKVGRDVTFYETSKYSSSPDRTVEINLPIRDDKNVIVVEDSDHDNLEEQQGRTLRDRAAIKQPERYEAEVAEIWDPSTYHEAMTCPDANLWKEAIREELQAHKKNGTWRLVAESEGNNIIDSKWVFRVKKNPSGKIDRYKARLCARGFLQRSGVDYAEIFSPVVRYDSL
ncbi:retrovirus-related pol polyprotein from transposon tnt 1-94 [Lasius niger]|uniref:Retrovirus-related pol polyprotein from transposon tnt 1-94 n=1 Tax=Lasius niger TaxID=67767 RepID=A0A0J7K724_LASNI|nr:retrovirus-related pol polyprotein from transposon tnt 1-94 [Lasius niger]